MKKNIIIVILLIIICCLGIEVYNNRKPEVSVNNETSDTINDIKEDITKKSEIKNEIQDEYTNNTSTIEETTIKNSNTTNSVISSSNEEIERTPIIEYTSADRAAAQGKPKVLKVYKLTEDELEFEYNSGFDFNTSIINRKISGIATINENNQYEYEEIYAGHKYRLLLEMQESNKMVRLYEYDGDNELFEISLF